MKNRNNESSNGSAGHYVQLQHIYKTFNKGSINEVPLFHDFNLTVDKGEFVTVVGSNGSGKTTMLNVICGSTQIDEGRIIVNERDVTQLKEHQRASFIGRVFQDPGKGTCPSLTILENMSLADNKGRPYGLTPGIKKRRRDQYCTLLEQLKLGLEDKTDVKVGSLSGGQRQALALLISTMVPVDLLILDEHTAALDPRISETIMELTDRLIAEKGVTTIMVTHNLRYAVEYGNRLLMMHEGGFVLDASEDEKKTHEVSDLLDLFNEISIECGN